jgi:hypothetical protein
LFSCLMWWKAKKNKNYGNEHEEKHIEVTLCSFFKLFSKLWKLFYSKLCVQEKQHTLPTPRHPKPFQFSCTKLIWI